MTRLRACLPSSVRIKEQRTKKRKNQRKVDNSDSQDALGVAAELVEVSAVVIQLEALSILRERCQIYLPGTQRRTFVVTAEKAGPIPSLFSHNVAASIAIDAGGEVDACGLAASLRSIAKVAQEHVDTNPASASATAGRSVLESVQRLAVRRMFVLHPFATLPGKAGSSCRHVAVAELQDLANLVFASGDMNLVGDHVELICQYASEQCIRDFVTWLLSFDALQTEAAGIVGTGSGDQPSSETTTPPPSLTLQPPRVRVLLRPSFYEIRAVRKHVLAVLGMELARCLHLAFPGATASDGRTSLFPASDGAVQAASRLALFVSSRRLADSAAELIEAPHMFFGVRVPALADGSAASAASALVHANDVLRFVLGLPSGYVHSSAEGAGEFMALVMLLDIALFSLGSDTGRNGPRTEKLAARVLVSTRRLLSVVAVAIPEFISASIFEWLAITTVTRAIRLCDKAWAEPSLEVVHVFAMNAACASSAGKRVLRSGLAGVIALWDYCAAKATVISPSLAQLTAGMLNLMAKLVDGAHAGCVGVTSAAQWRQFQVAANKRQKPKLDPSLRAVLTDIQARIAGLESCPALAWWGSANLAAPLLDITRICLELHVDPSVSGQQPLHAGSLLWRSVAALSPGRTGATAGCSAPSPPQLSLMRSIMRFLTFYGTQDLSEHDLGNSVSLALQLSQATGDGGSVLSAFVSHVGEPSRVPRMLDAVLNEFQQLSHSSAVAVSPRCVTAMEALSAMLVALRAKQHWIVVSQRAARVLNSVLSLAQHWTLCGVVEEPETHGLCHALAVLVSMLRQTRDITMGLRETSLCLQVLMFWTRPISFVVAGSDVFKGTYECLSAMLEHRPHALYGCSSVFVMVVRGMLRRSFECNDVALGAELLRHTSRIFEEMSRPMHRSAMRHYGVHLLCDAVDFALKHGWNKRDNQHLRRGIFCLLEACTEYQTQMLYASLNASGRSLLRKMRADFARQQFKGEV